MQIGLPLALVPRPTDLLGAQADHHGVDRVVAVVAAVLLLAFMLGGRVQAFGLSVVRIEEEAPLPSEPAGPDPIGREDAALPTALR